MDLLVCLPRGRCFDAYTGVSLFNVTGVPGFAAQTGQQCGSTSRISYIRGYDGSKGEVLRDVYENLGTAADPNWYLAEWNMSKLWLYDINPYTGGGSLSPDVVNATNGVLIPTLPIPITGETGTLPNGAGVFVPYGSTITVNGNISIGAVKLFPQLIH